MAVIQRARLSVDKKFVTEVLRADLERLRAARIQAAIEKRDAHVVVEKKPEAPIQWMIGTND